MDNKKTKDLLCFALCLILVALSGNALADDVVKKSTVEKPKLCLGGDYEAMAEKVKRYDKIIAKYNKQYDVSVALIKAVITAESCINPNAKSPKGALGLMQLMPATAKRFGVTNRLDPDSNIKAGTRYLKFLLENYDDDLLDAVAAYNSGEGSVNKYNGVPPYQETRHYVSKVAALYKYYSQNEGSKTDDDFLNNDLAQVIFVPSVIQGSRLSPYKNQNRHSSRGECENHANTRLRQSTTVETSGVIWQRFYVARKGDTLMRVMQRTGVHKTKVSQMNGISSRARLKEGQRLLVWECRKG